MTRHYLFTGWHDPGNIIVQSINRIGDSLEPGGLDMRKAITAAGLIILLAFFVVQGCSNDNPVGASNDPAPPALPSLSTMRIDISLFESADVDAHALREGGIERVLLHANTTHLNFLNAAVRVLFLNVVVYSALVEPVAAFGVAINSVPQLQPDGSWLWTYIYVGPEAEYSIYLYGKSAGDYVEWRMEVSSTDPAMILDHFTWFDGIVYSDENSGYWQFYEPAESPAAAVVAGAAGTPGVNSIRIDWENGEGGESRLVILVNKPGVPGEGTTLTFFESSAMSAIDFYDAENGDNGNISWYPDGSGSIEWPDYRDGIKSCWNEVQLDVICP
jgi:hypothetical protein